MFAKLRPRSVYDVMAAIACFGVLAGGTAYAAATITGADVVDSSLTGVDVKGKQRTSTTPAVNGTILTQDVGGQEAHAASGTPFIDGTLTQWDIKNGSVRSDDIADNTLRGVDINEETLSKVPDADTLDGMNSTDFVQGKGNAYRGQADAELDVTANEVVSIPGFGTLEVHSRRLSDMENSCFLLWSNRSGADQRMVWFNKDGVGVQEASRFGRNVTPLETRDPYVVLLQVGTGDRTVTVTATLSLLDTEVCRSSAQALAQID